MRPYGLFRCLGGAVQISVGSEMLWRKFCGAFGLDAEAAGVATNAVRVRHRSTTIELVEQAFAAYPAAELLEKLRLAGIPAGKVRSLDEVYAWDQVQSQGLAVDVEHEVLGRITLPGPPLRFFDATAAGEREKTPARHSAPPLLNRHGASIRSWLASDTPAPS